MVLKLSKEHKEYMINEIQRYFEVERGEQLGVIATEDIFDFFIKELGPIMYNKGVNDAKGMVEQKLMNIEEDILSLVRPVGK